jgi:hypothetical protein
MLKCPGLLRNTTQNTSNHLKQYFITSKPGIQLPVFRDVDRHVELVQCDLCGLFLSLTKQRLPTHLKSHRGFKGTFNVISIVILNIACRSVAILGLPRDLLARTPKRVGVTSGCLGIFPRQPLGTWSRLRSWERLKCVSRSNFESDEKHTTQVAESLGLRLQTHYLPILWKNTVVLPILCCHPLLQVISVSSFCRPRWCFTRSNMLHCSSKCVATSGR